MGQSKARLSQQLLVAVCTTMLLILTLQLQVEGREETEAGRMRLVGSVGGGRPAKGRRGMMHMVFYMHDIVAPPASATAVVVGAQKGQLTGPPKLGATFIFDDKLTAGPDPNSMEIGRGQGLYTLASLTSADLLLVFTAVLHRPAKYNGSTICLHGSDRIFLPEREIGIVGGTGHFRFARGYAILSSALFNASTGNAVIKFNLTMHLS